MSTEPENQKPDFTPPEGATAHQTAIDVPFPDSYVYSNASATSVSFMDIRIGFAEILPDGKGHPRIGIVMPPEHAAHLVLSLFKQIAAFEQNFGPIRNPEWRMYQEKIKANVQEHLKKLAQSEAEEQKS